MADEAAAPAANDTPAPVAAPAENLSTNDAVAALRERRKAPEAPTREPATPREEAGAAETESPSQEEDAAAVDAQPPGDDEEADRAGEPPIEPPKSLTKAEREAFAALPPELQEAWANRERDRETYYRKGHDEAAQKARAAEAREQAAEQARQQYEQALPSLLAQFQGQFAAEFQDIKTWDDVKAMREGDPMRFMAWQEAREKGNTLQREAQAAQQRQQYEQANNWQQFVAEQDKAFAEKAPEFKDPKKAAQMTADARSLLADVGFTPEEIQSWQSGRPVSPQDHRWQLVLRDATRYRAAEKARKAALPKPVPPVQRPGVATTRGEVSTGYIRDLTNKLKATPNSTDAAVALLRAKRKAS